MSQNFTIPSYSPEAPSALFGRPPATYEDYYFVRAFLRAFAVRAPALAHQDPARGLPFLPRAKYDDTHETRQNEVITSGACVIALIIFIFTSRIATKVYIKQLIWSLDDWIMGFATILSIANLAMYMCAATYGGLGKHLWNVTYHEYVEFLKYENAGNISQFTILALLKITMSLFLRRALGHTRRYWRRAVEAFIVLLVLYSIATLIAIPIWKAPQPRHYFDPVWSGAQPTAPPVKTPAIFFVAVMLISAFFDIILLLMPIIIFSPLQMPFWKRIRFSLLFITGACTTGTSITRAILSLNATVWRKGGFPDETVETVAPYKWGASELALTFLTANMPILNSVAYTLYQKYAQRERFDEMSKSSGAATSDSSNGDDSEGSDHDSRYREHSGERLAKNKLYSSRAAEVESKV